MLWKCLIKYKGTNEYIEELQHSDGALQIDTSKIQSVSASRFKYKAKGPSAVFTSPTDGKKYLVPEWIEVHPNTTINDIYWVKPKSRKIKPQIFKIKNYIIRYNSDKKVYVCNCQGYFRVKDKTIGCKHIQQLKAENSK